ncbi:CDP-alcohol phosphatidyltransferase family protein [Nonomuraea sp. NPDC050790]|uniref:CDP-alcohol phosphatidyltransferase family protein n=1 Tax=Nonomuraea sp. NPDC050790 TaxID=3364371 RepID=UPI003793732A
MRTYSLDDVYATRKRRDSWWTVYFVDPVACRVALTVANRTSVTPNALTVFSLVLGLVSAACFAVDELAAGAVVFYLSFMIDCVDGKIARLKGTGTPFGLWLDYVGDRVRVVCCAAGLAIGQYLLTHNVEFIVLGAAVAVLDLFRYVNAPQMKRVREVVREGMPPKPAPAVEVSEEVVVRPARNPSFMRRLNKYLARRRVRSHLISGIEFHAAVFVVAPLIGAAALIPISAAASVLLLANEIFLVYRMWLFARRFAVVSSSQESREHVLV